MSKEYIEKRVELTLLALEAMPERSEEIITNIISEAIEKGQEIGDDIAERETKADLKDAVESAINSLVYWCKSGCGCRYPNGDGSHEFSCAWEMNKTVDSEELLEVIHAIFTPKEDAGAGGNGLVPHIKKEGDTTTYSFALSEDSKHFVKKIKYPSHKELDMDYYRKLVEAENFDALFNYGFKKGQEESLTNQKKILKRLRKIVMAGNHYLRENIEQYIRILDEELYPLEKDSNK